MAGIFPAAGTSADDAINTIANPTLATGCTALWYDTGRCAPKFDAKAANAVMAEIINAVNCDAVTEPEGGLAYDCNRLDNLCLALTSLRALLEAQLFSVDKCLTATIATVPTTACAVVPLAQFTDAAGCRKIGLYPSTSQVVDNGVVCDLYPAGTNFAAPASPTNPATYYTAADLAADQVANNVNFAKLSTNNTKVLDFNFALACDNIPLEALLTGTIVFDPTANGGNGGSSTFAVRVDGAFLLSANNVLVTFPAFTNFEQGYQAVLNIGGLAAGNHNIQIYVVATGAGGTIPAQARVACTAGAANSSTWQLDIRHRS